MDRPNRIRQLYGYSVCLIGVVAVLICTAGVLHNAFDLSDPIAADRYVGESLRSFEGYKATRGGAPRPNEMKTPPDSASDETLRPRYEALRADRIASTTFRARKELVSNLAVLLLAAGLFITHWRWLRRVADDDAPKRVD